MGKTKKKHHLIIILASVVVAIAVVLSLLTTLAIAGPPMSNDACLNLALRIRDADRDDALESNQSLRETATPVACTNFCTSNLQTIQTELFKRQIGAADPLITATIIPFPPDVNNTAEDLAYANSFPFGLIAYFCDAALSPGTDLTDPMTSFTSAFVVVGAPGGSSDPCGILNALCGPATPP